MGGVVVRGQGRGEKPATTVTNRVQERPPRSSSPVTRDRNPTAIGETEAGYVDGVCRRMFAPTGIGPAPDAAAGKAAEVVDTDDAAAQHADRRRLHYLAIQTSKAAASGHARTTRGRAGDVRRTTPVKRHVGP